MPCVLECLYGVLLYIYLQKCAKLLRQRKQVRRGPNPQHHTPYTLHSTPYTLHHTPHTLHHTPYTTHPTPYTLYPTPYTLHPPAVLSLSRALALSRA